MFTLYSLYPKYSASSCQTEAVFCQETSECQIWICRSVQRNSFSHRLSVVEHAGRGVDIQDLLRRNRRLRKGGKLGLGEEYVKVGHGHHLKHFCVMMFVHLYYSCFQVQLRQYSKQFFQKMLIQIYIRPFLQKGCLSI